MKNRNIIIAAILGFALIMTASTTSCGKKENKDAVASSTQSEDPGVVKENMHTPGAAAVFYYDFSDVFMSSVRKMLDANLEKAGIKYINYDGKGEQERQSLQIEKVLEQNPGMLIINLVDVQEDEPAAMEAVRMAKEKKVPVIFFNREVSDAVINAYDKCVFVGTDCEEAGRMQGQMIAEHLLANFEDLDLNHDGRISYILFKGQEGNAEAEARTKFSVLDCNKLLKKAGKKPLKFYDPSNKKGYLVDDYGKWSSAAANQYMSEILKHNSIKNKNMIELVIANNDEMAKGAIVALEDKEFNIGIPERHIPVFGVDATKEAKKLIKEGKMTGTIKQDAQAMVDAISSIAKNASENKSMLSGLSDLKKDDGVDKIRISYQIYRGE